jgi:hypothetical protein
MIKQISRWAGHVAGMRRRSAISYFFEIQKERNDLEKE